MTKIRLAVLISGRGSNLQALIDACAKPGFPAEIAVVISNQPDALGLERAATAGIPAMIVDNAYFKGDKAGFEQSLTDTINQYNVDLICLAGFMRILSADFLARFKDKVINIHPSLLPAHKGLDTHASVLKAGDTAHGCSVHVVTPGMDEGDIILSRTVTVKKGDDEAALAARVLVEEHIAYPEAVRQIALKEITIRGGHVVRQGKTAKISQPETKMSHHDTHHAAPVADAEAIARSHQMWNAFTKGSTYAGGGVVLVLILLAVLVA